MRSKLHGWNLTGLNPSIYGFGAYFITFLLVE
jgi:hypothetical protein